MFVKGVMLGGPVYPNGTTPHDARRAFMTDQMEVGLPRAVTHAEITAAYAWALTYEPDCLADSWCDAEGVWRKVNYSEV